MLRYAEMNPLHVRFGIWREGFDGMKFVCKVEYAAVPCPTKQLPWTWWSSLVRTPEDLGFELQKALVARQKRQVAATAAAARARLRAARRAAAPAPSPTPGRRMPHAAGAGADRAARRQRLTDSALSGPRPAGPPGGAWSFHVIEIR